MNSLLNNLNKASRRKGIRHGGGDGSTIGEKEEGREREEGARWRWIQHRGGERRAEEQPRAALPSAGGELGRRSSGGAVLVRG